MIGKAIVSVAAILFAFGADAIEASDDYRSPRNPERRVRASTELIVLHTTEAPERSSLNKVSDRGECHYCVTDDGDVYRIVDRDKVAFHAGRSMWKGKEDVDEFSVGIECVGNHDKAMPEAQLKSIRALVKELQSMYHLSDEKVVCHAHVAYGAPNKWHRFKHRGRKRCGMLFAMPSVRRVLQLQQRPARDEDVRAGRLRNADEFLRKVLYGNVDTMRSTYAQLAPQPAKKESSGLFSWIGSAKSSAPAAKPAPSKPAVAPAKPVQSVAKPRSAVAAKPVQPAAPPRLKSFPQTPEELCAAGYVIRGTVTKERTARKIVGDKWNASDTYYVIRNKAVPGNIVNPARIELGMTIWTKK